MDLGLYEPLAIALGLGLLVGMQRQWRQSEIAGIRTFPLVTMLGTLTASLDQQQLGWLSAAGLLSVTIVLYIGNQAKFQGMEFDPGMTTETAALLMYAVGAALGAGYTGPAIAVGGVTSVLLHWKEPLHTFVKRIGREDFRAVIHLVLIALVILPVLPNETFGPYDVLNPYKIWLMVVLIVGISLVAYVAYKILGVRAGSVLGGILGGLISSTATTVSYARQTKSNAGSAPLAALVIMLASTIVHGRVLLEIAVVAPALLPAALPPLAVLASVMAVTCVWLLRRAGDQTCGNPYHDNPAQLKAAIVFAVMYAIVLLMAAAAKAQFGSRALYAVAVLSGMTDMDAITLSTAELAKSERITMSTAWRVIVLATMSNLVFKGAAVAVLGGRRLLIYIAGLFGLALATGAALLAFWPY